MDLGKLRNFLREKNWDNDDLLFLVQSCKEVFIDVMLRIENGKKIVNNTNKEKQK